MNTFDYRTDPEFKSGEIENGSIFIQLKATDTLNILSDGQTLSFSIKRRHAVLWGKEPNPVMLIVYSVQDNKAFWLHMQPYLKNATFALPPRNQEDVTVHLSKQFLLDEHAVDSFRQLKNDVMKQIEGLNLYA